MFSIIIVQLAIQARVAGCVQKADSLHDEHRGLHVHHHDQWVHPTTVKNESSFLNKLNLTEHGTKDILDIAGVQDEETAKCKK